MNIQSVNTTLRGCTQESPLLSQHEISLETNMIFFEQQTQINEYMHEMNLFEH